MNYKPKKSKGSFTWSGWLGLFILLATSGFLGRLKWHQHLRQREVELEKAKLQTQAKELRQDTEEMGKVLSFLETPEFQEKLARQQFNLKKPGEEVYTFTSKTEYLPEQTDTTQNSKENNFRKWWEYFYPDNN
jgi:cell division protein FtsB